MARILGEIAIQGECPAEKRGLVLQRLASELCADAWYWVAVTRLAGGRLALERVHQKSGFCDREIAGHFDSGRTDAITLKDSVADSPTAKQRGVVEEAWDSRPEFSAGRPAGSYVLSIHSAGALDSCVMLFRTEVRPKFSERELKIAHGILGAVPWLHEAVVQAEGPDEVLPPRLGEVLGLLLRGLPRKEIADRMGISLHTVHGYARDLYGRFAVHSQAELICRLSQRRDAA
jgi:DNA-binding CsgD family transcriptional regulator